MRVTIDEDSCIGCGLCVEECPEVFEMDDDKVRVKTGGVAGDVADSCKGVAENCPAEAIQIEN